MLFVSTLLASIWTWFGPGLQLLVERATHLQVFLDAATFLSADAVLLLLLLSLLFSRQHWQQ